MRKNLIILSLAILIFAYALQLPAFAKPAHKDVELSVSITHYSVGSFDSHGKENDIAIYGRLKIKSDDGIDGYVRLTLHLKGIDGSKGKWSFTEKLSINEEDGDFNGKFVFLVFNIKNGVYEAYIEVEYLGYSAESETVIVDPPGGTPGPIGFGVDSS